ncbi:hypothetical protein CQ047_02195 [Microbacterium sp. MYb72]|jgi:lysylphosphatidylglycerol synthetase-like protein (DUF2156 family)|uniref:hypothetical protein n=1 Tax=Microbacterium sp. MYb72 TaxID=1848693 RepID=UPI000CFCE050|nr:hypothetical protein [Microbacterium sp. MYb72]PRB11888.1 hypothetical protein CQ047_02195 [Microbacterium sp. MYb72]
MIEPRQVTARLSPAAFAAALVLFAGVATAAGLPDITIRYVSFAAMIAAIVSGVVAVRYGPAWVRAVSAVVAVIALMLGSTFFGLTYS